MAWLEMSEEAALSCGHALALQPQSRPALLLQAGMADPGRERLEPLLAREATPTGQPPERLLPEVLHWLRSRAVDRIDSAPVPLDRP
jgi:hypothetical protein